MAFTCNGGITTNTISEMKANLQLSKVAEEGPIIGKFKEEYLNCVKY